MAERHDAELNIEPVLQAWPELPPNRAAMERVTALMVAGMAAAHADAAEPGESHFRLLTIIWASIILGGYLTWDLLAEWFAANPVLTGLLSALGFLGLVTPLLLLPILTSTDEGSV